MRRRRIITSLTPDGSLLQMNRWKLLKGGDSSIDQRLQLIGSIGNHCGFRAFRLHRDLILCV
jgi:hypothetical protein